MVQIFFTIIFLAQLIVTYFLINAIKKANTKVLEISSQVEKENIKLSKDLKTLRKSMLETCIKTTDTVCSIYNLPQTMSKNFAQSIGKKLLYSILHVNLRKMLSTVGVILAIKKFLKFS